MIPILSVAHTRALEAPYVTNGPDVLVRRAGTALALTAKEMLGTCYSRRVAVLVGPGLNGADGRVAGSWLSERGAKVDLIAVATQPRVLRGYDLIIDAAFGIGCSKPYVAPANPQGIAVLAADVPSGVHADTGALLGSPMRATVTLAMNAFKFAHVNGASREMVGELRVANLGIEIQASDFVIEDDDVGDFVRSARDDHKWKHALDVYAGSSLMSGAAALVTNGALAAGASMVRLQSRGELASNVSIAPEVVRFDGLVGDTRSRATVAGPGVGRDADAWLCERLATLRHPVVLDADALVAPVVELARGRADWVLTPHDGEFQRLSGETLNADRIASVRSLSKDLGCVVLLKGPTTVIADPTGALRIVMSGTSALATAGSGDVLSGFIGAALARGHDTLDAASKAAYLHGRAGQLLGPYAVASDLPAALTTVMTRMPLRSRGEGALRAVTA